MATDPATWNYVPGQVHSTYAAGQVDIDAKGFLDALHKLQDAGVDLQQDLIAYTLELLSRIQNKTPVRTGRARASWHAVLPDKTDTFSYTDNQGHGFDGTLQGVKTGQWDTMVGSNVDYMIFLEAGHSRQAPNGMVALSLLELKGALEARLADTIKKASGG